MTATAMQKTVTDGANHTAEFEYDSSGNCISKTLKYTSEGAQKTVTEHYVYDENNNLVQIIDSSGNITSTEYNSMGKVALATDEKGRRTSYEYDNLGNLIEINYADGTSESFTYDNEGNNLTATDRLGRTVTMEYDGVGNLLSKTYPNGAAVTYTYNALNQLTSENGTSYQYDDAGNLISVTSDTKSVLYAYNAENKMIRATVQEGNSVSVEEYEYDYAGNRTVKKSENDYTYYLNDVSGSLTQVLAELDADGNEKCWYTIGADLISQERNGAVSTYLYDGHGSVRGLSDETGAVTDTYNYDAWGELLDKTGTTENSYLYCGEQLDSATGLYYLRARYMNPSTGTFTTMDTYAGSIFDPTSLHKYLYVIKRNIIHLRKRKSRAKNSKKSPRSNTLWGDF